ncbi:hypothetical protein [Helicobacter sp. 23-1045]
MGKFHIRFCDLFPSLRDSAKQNRGNPYLDFAFLCESQNLP